MLGFQTSGLVMESVDTATRGRFYETPIIPVRFGKGLFAAQYDLAGYIDDGSVGTVCRAAFIRPARGEGEGDEGSKLHRALMERSTLRLRVPGKKFAVKITSLRGLSHVQRARVVKEYRRTARLQHPNVVPLIEVIHDDETIYMVMELIEGGNLVDYVCDQSPLGRLSENDSFLVFAQLVALRHVHMLDVVHRDVKMQNVLVTPKGHAFLCDFGLSTRIVASRGARQRASCGTVLFAAPEVLAMQPYLGPEVDVWSLGVVLFAIATGSMPFYSEDDAVVKEMIISEDFTFPKSVPISAELVALLRGMLTKNRERRFTLDMVRDSLWFRMRESWFLHLSLATSTQFIPALFAHSIESKSSSSHSSTGTSSSATATPTLSCSPSSPSPAIEFIALTHEHELYLASSAFALSPPPTPTHAPLPPSQSNHQTAANHNGNATGTISSKRRSLLLSLPKVYQRIKRVITPKRKNSNTWNPSEEDEEDEEDVMLDSEAVVRGEVFSHSGLLMVGTEEEKNVIPPHPLSPSIKPTESPVLPNTNGSHSPQTSPSVKGSSSPGARRLKRSDEREKKSEEKDEGGRPRRRSLSTSSKPPSDERMFEVEEWEAAVETPVSAIAEAQACAGSAAGSVVGSTKGSPTNGSAPEIVVDAGETSGLRVSRKREKKEREREKDRTRSKSGSRSRSRSTSPKRAGTGVAEEVRLIAMSVNSAQYEEERRKREERRSRRKSAEIIPIFVSLDSESELRRKQSAQQQ